MNRPHLAKKNVIYDLYFFRKNVQIGKIRLRSTNYSYVFLDLIQYEYVPPVAVSSETTASWFYV